MLHLLKVMGTIRWPAKSIATILVLAVLFLCNPSIVSAQNVTRLDHEHVRGPKISACVLALSGLGSGNVAVPQTESGLKSRTGRPYYWPYVGNFVDHHKIFNESNLSFSRVIVARAVRDFHEDGPLKAYRTLLGDGISDLMGMKLFKVKVDFPSSLEHYQESLRKLINQGLCCSFDPETKTITVPELDLKNTEIISTNFRPIMEDLFLTTLEEYVHATQFLHGQALSNRRKFSITGTPYDFSELEQDIPLLFEEWGLPISRELLSRYFRYHVFDKYDRL